MIRGTVVIAWRMTVRHPELRSHSLKTWIACARSKMRNLIAVMSMMAFYLHVGYFAQFLIGELDREIALLDEAECQHLADPRRRGGASDCHDRERGSLASDLVRAILLGDCSFQIVRLL